MDGTTGKINITNNSYVMHLFNGAWLTKDRKEYFMLFREYYNKYNSLYPEFIAVIVTKILATYKIKGLLETTKNIIKF